jgi:Spy/CpxP family protein refolding chaperone
MMQLLLLFLLFWQPLLANHDKQFENYHREKQEHMPNNLQALNLSKVQHQQLKVILQEHRAKLMELHQEEERLEEMLKVFFTSEHFDKDTFLAQKERLKLKTASIETAFFVQLHGLFSPKQRVVFAQYIEEWEVE